MRTFKTRTEDQFKNNRKQKRRISTKRRQKERCRVRSDSTVHCMRCVVFRGLISQSIPGSFRPMTQDFQGQSTVRFTTPQLHPSFPSFSTSFAVPLVHQLFKACPVAKLTRTQLLTCALINLHTILEFCSCCALPSCPSTKRKLSALSWNKCLQIIGTSNALKAQVVVGHHKFK